MKLFFENSVNEKDSVLKSFIFYHIPEKLLRQKARCIRMNINLTNTSR